MALGLCGCAYISQTRGLIDETEYKEVLSALETFGLDTNVSGLCAGDILQATRLDKKMDNGRIRYVLMKGIGNCFTDASVTDQEQLDAIRSILTDEA